eukprot:8802015-Heterocapsa_arctica.AAC.1
MIGIVGHTHATHTGGVLCAYSVLQDVLHALQKLVDVYHVDDPRRLIIALQASHEHEDVRSR